MFSSWQLGSETKVLKAQDFNILNQTEDMPTFEDFLEFVMTALTGIVQVISHVTSKVSTV